MYHKGDRAKVIKGPFAGWEGTIIESSDYGVWLRRTDDPSVRFCCLNFSDVLCLEPV
jgi:hypothetical protein